MVYTLLFIRSKEGVVRGLGRHHPQPGAGVRQRPAAGVRRPGAQLAPGGRGPTAHTVAGPGGASGAGAATGARGCFKPYKK